MSEDLKLTIEFAARERDVETLPDGSRVVYGAVITAPESASGQVRDLVLWADGSVSLLADQRRSATTTAKDPE